ncbi:MAG: energy transducer TonB [Janthinobacterium lividum]
MGSVVWSQTLDRPLQVGGDVQPPRLMKQVNVATPIGHQLRELQAEAVFALLIGTTGHVVKARLIKSCGSKAFDEEFDKAVRQYEFVPATLRGQPVAVEFSVSINIDPF